MHTRHWRREQTVLPFRAFTLCLRYWCCRRCQPKNNKVTQNTIKTISYIGRPAPTSTWRIQWKKVRNSTKPSDRLDLGASATQKLHKYLCPNCCILIYVHNIRPTYLIIQIFFCFSLRRCAHWRWHSCVRRCALCNTLWAEHIVLRIRFFALFPSLTVYNVEPQIIMLQQLRVESFPVRRLLVFFHTLHAYCTLFSIHITYIRFSAKDSMAHCFCYLSCATNIFHCILLSRSLSPLKAHHTQTPHVLASIRYFCHSWFAVTFH